MPHVIDNRSLLARRGAAVPRGGATATPTLIDRAENAELWDVEGRRYVDFAGGIAVLNVGHRHPKVIAAVQAQLERFTHLAFHVTAYELYIELAERLNALAPFTGPAKTIFFTTGAEAVENCVKIARAATGRTGVICFSGAFHGRTALSSAMTGKVNPYKRQFGPSVPEIFRVPFPAPHLDVTVEDSLRAALSLHRRYRPVARSGHRHRAGAGRGRVQCGAARRILAEGVNGPTTPDADRVLDEHRDEVFVIPDILCNSGGVIVSYFEWVQGLQRLFWSEEEVKNRLKTLMDRAFANVMHRSAKDGVSHRIAATAMGVERVQAAKRARGPFP